MKTRVVTTLGLFSALALASAQTIPNPSFEANSFINGNGYISGNSPIAGWTTTNPNRAGLNPASASPFADNGTIPDGANVAFIQNAANSSLSTMISNLTVGQTYKVNFRVNARSGNTPNLKVDIAGTNVINTTVTPVGGSNPYRYLAFDFTAAAPTQTLTLRNDASGDHTVLVDNFSIAWQGIPNPSFEANSFTNWPGYISGNSPIAGWTTTNPNRAGLNPASGSPFADNGAVPHGNNVAFIQSDTNSSLSTVISNLTIGETYKVNFRVNARSTVGNTPNLKVSIDGVNIINTAVTPADGNTAYNYKYFAFDFTAAATSQTMTLSNDASGDHTVLLDDFSIAPRNSGWSYAAWNDDATSGVAATNNYTHAYKFGSSTATSINGVIFTGIAGPYPSVTGSFYTAGVFAVSNNDTNNLTTGTGGSAVLARDFVYGGSGESLLIKGLVVGKSYLATIYSVGFDSSGARAATFSVGDDRLTVNQDQFGNNNGIRVSYYYTAGSSRSIALFYNPLQGDVSFHTYGFSNYELSNSNSHAAFLVVTSLADSGPGTLRQAIADSESGDTITFAASGTVGLASPLFITTSLNIAGPGPAKLAVNGNLSSRVFELKPGLTANISGLTIQNGRWPNGGGLGNFGTMVLSNCVITGNGATESGGFGGAIHNGTSGVLSLIACTVRNNSAGNGANGTHGADGTFTHPNGYDALTPGRPGGNGGGIYNEGVLAMTACTINNNGAGKGGLGAYGGEGRDSFFGVSCGDGGNGTDGGNGGSGGGVYNGPGATLALTNCAIYGNAAGSGGDGGAGGPPGRIDNNFNQNYCGNWGRNGTGGKGLDGGGIYNAASSSGLVLVACTLSANAAGDGGYGGGGIGGNGGGIFADTASGVSRLWNTVVANNHPGAWNGFSAGVAPDLLGTNFVSHGYNLVGLNDNHFILVNSNATDIVPAPNQQIDAMLAPLGNYGGPTQTAPPRPGSPAINAGDDALTNTLATDQRGFPRKIGAHVDIGAAEYTPVNPIVTNTADSGGGSLRDAVTFATNGTTITFASPLSGKTNILTSGQLAIYGSLTIDASALPGGFKISGNHSNRIFEVSTGATVTLNSLSLINGYAGAGDSGGAILVDSGGTLTLTNCTVSGNSATGVGGGIGNSGGVVTINNSTLAGNSASGAGAIENNNGTLTINASTLSGNSATGNGGAIDNDAGATLRVNNSTFSGNSAGGGGGGIENYQASATLNNCTLSGNSAGGAAGINNYGTLALTNTIVAGNTAPFLPNLNLDSSGSFTGANNLTDGDPHLSPLGNYGGPTLTMPPLAGSPALDAGLDSVTNLLATDQRGFPRRYGPHVDIGAAEPQLGNVSSLNDSGAGSLRDTLATSQSVVGFAPSLDGGTLTLTSGQIALSNNLTIDASTLPRGLTISGNNSTRIFEVNPGATVTLDSLVLLNGNAGSGSGGGIKVDGGGTLTLTNCYLSGNSATYGGGLANNGTITVSASTLSANIATNNGGAIDNEAGATLTLYNSTLSGNSAGGAGGGLEAFQATVTAINCTLSDNSAASAGGINNYGTLVLTNTIVAGNNAQVDPNIYTDTSGYFVGVNNLINPNPLLAPLDNYGGPTPTMPPLAGSPAIDAGRDSITNFLATDQRGYPRQSGAHVDIGAAEFQVVSAANAPVLMNPVVQANGALMFGFTSSPDAAFTVLASTNLALPLGQWTILGAPVQDAPGQYHFTDPDATIYPQRFYRVVSP